jgi:hypothetical protein
MRFIVFYNPLFFNEKGFNNAKDCASGKKDVVSRFDHITKNRATCLSTSCGYYFCLEYCVRVTYVEQ